MEKNKNKKEYINLIPSIQKSNVKKLNLFPPQNKIPR